MILNQHEAFMGSGVGVGGLPFGMGLWVRDLKLKLVDSFLF